MELAAINLAVVTALLCAFVCLITAATAFLVGRAPGWEDFGWFGWVAVTAAGVSAANSVNTLPLADAAYAWGGRIQFLLLTLHVLAWLGYVSAWARSPLTRRARRLVVAATVGPGLLALWPGALYGDVATRRPAPWLGVVYHDAVVTAPGHVILAATLLAGAWGLLRIVRLARAGAPYGKIHVACASALFLLVVHDAMLTLGVPAPTPYLIDFGFYLPIAALGLIGVHRITRASTELMALRAGLEEKVGERTAQLERAQAALARAERLAALGQLSAGVAHEVNNPTAVIAANLAFVSREVAHVASSEVRSALDDARGGLLRISGLTQQLLLAGRAAARPMALVPVDVAAACEGALQAARARGAGRVSLVAAVPPGLTVLAQGTALEQVLTNLVVNGIQAAAPGRPGRVSVRAEPRGERVRITVEDDGEGMTAETLARVGEPFYTTKPVGSGTGLGLAVVRGLVQAMRGTLELTSAPGQGTRAHVDLAPGEPTPLGTPAAEPAAQSVA